MIKRLFILLLAAQCSAQVTLLPKTTVLPKTSIVVGVPVVATPTFSPVSPYWGGNTTVNIADATTGAAITYCTSNSGTCTPGTSYTTGISFTSSGPTNICAFATLANYTTSSTACWAGTYSTGGSYTSQVCTFGSDTSSTTFVCSSSLTVSTGDIIVVATNAGSTSNTLSSCSLSAGTATVSWTVDTSMTVTENINNNTLGWCHGNVTAGGTATPRAVWGTAASGDTLIAAAFSGLINTIDASVAVNNSSGSTSTNGVTPGSMTTTVNGDTLVGATSDIISPTSATISAGTSSVSFTKITCVAGNSFSQLCMEWGNQTTAAAGTTAAWTYNVSHANLTGAAAFEP